MSPTREGLVNPLPPNMNPGLSAATQSTMLSLLGNPRNSYTQSCQPITNSRLKSLVVVDRVGPFQVQGLRPAVQSLKDVLSDIQLQEPEVYHVLGTAGMLCARYVRGSNTSISNHSWGTAIDLTIQGILDIRGDKKAQVGLQKIAPIFNKHSWYWGAAFGIEDSMHFEVSDEMIRQWYKEDKFNSAPTRSPEPILSLGDRGYQVRELQELLNQAGAQLKVDGIFGHATFVATMAFQGGKGLRADGVVGEVTWKALKA